MSADYKVDTVEGGVRNLCALISVVCEIQFNLGAGERDERIDSLLWIARDLAEGVATASEDNLADIRGRT